jgi:hypothetical protein
MLLQSFRISHPSIFVRIIRPKSRCEREIGPNMSMKGSKQAFEFHTDEWDHVGRLVDGLHKQKVSIKSSV